MVNAQRCFHVEVVKMCRVTDAFIKSHIKKALWNLECADKLEPNPDIKRLIEELKEVIVLKACEE